MSSNVLGYYWMTHITPYWKEYIEDTIRTKCINGTYVRPLPKSCAELVQRIYELTPIVMNEYGIIKKNRFRC